MIGFTGTKRGMTMPQAQTVASLLKMARDVQAGHVTRRPVFHHGLCVGADAQGHEIAHALGYRIIGHPASDVAEEYRADLVLGLTPDVVEPAVPALVRDSVIASEPILVAAPAQDAEVRRSGTWATIRRGWLSRGTVVHIVFPDGRSTWSEDRDYAVASEDS